MIELENLNRTFQVGVQRIHALKKINLTINKGEYVSIMGPSGSGKSTLLNVIALLDQPSSGKYTLNKQVVTQLNDDQLAQVRRENIGFVPQNPFTSLSPMTKIEKQFFCSSSKKLELLKLVGLESWVLNRFPTQLSGGQLQRVVIAISLSTNAKLLLLDEPVAGVAGPLAEKIFNNLRNIVSQTGISILVIEHNMDFILRRGVDRIIVMDQGKVLMQGTPDEVKDSKEVIEAYLGGAG